MWPLILTTLPHYIAAIIAGPTWPIYQCIIIASTTLSVAWHATGSPPTSFLGICDHIAAGIWFVADCYYLYEHLVYIILLNTLSAALNVLATRSNISYEYTHSIWHIINAGKSIYVANILAQGRS
jgi:hypothetical protein